MSWFDLIERVASLDPHRIDMRAEVSWYAYSLGMKYPERREEILEQLTEILYG